MFELKIRTASAAFEDDPGELARILRVAANMVDGAADRRREASLTDANGNTVGTFRIDPTED
jgi:hypothetical protein